jgi:RNA polymerase sigma factor (sigma-70 family)
MSVATDFDYPSLSFYIDLAKKTINKFGSKMYIGLSKEMLNNEDAVSDVAHAIMIADWRYDDDRAGKITGKKKTRYSYRNQCALWAIQTYATKARKKKNHYFSLDNYIDGDDENSSFDSILADSKQIPAIECILEQEKHELTASLLENIFNSNILTDKQVQQIRMYYIDGMTLQEIGDKFNITREAVRQTVKNGLDKLKVLFADA